MGMNRPSHDVGSVLSSQLASSAAPFSLTVTLSARQLFPLFALLAFAASLSLGESTVRGSPPTESRRGGGASADFSNLKFGGTIVVTGTNTSEVIPPSNNTETRKRLGPIFGLPAYDNIGLNFNFLIATGSPPLGFFPFGFFSASLYDDIRLAPGFGHGTIKRISIVLGNGNREGFDPFLVWLMFWEKNGPAADPLYTPGPGKLLWNLPFPVFMAAQTFYVIDIPVDFFSASGDFKIPGNGAFYAGIYLTSGSIFHDPSRLDNIGISMTGPPRLGSTTLGPKSLLVYPIDNVPYPFNFTTYPTGGAASDNSSWGQTSMSWAFEALPSPCPDGWCCE